MTAIRDTATRIAQGARQLARASTQGASRRMRGAVETGLGSVHGAFLGSIWTLPTLATTPALLTAKALGLTDSLFSGQGPGTVSQFGPTRPDGTGRLLSLLARLRMHEDVFATMGVDTGKVRVGFFGGYMTDMAPKGFYPEPTVGWLRTFGFERESGHRALNTELSIEENAPRVGEFLAKAKQDGVYTLLMAHSFGSAHVEDWLQRHQGELDHVVGATYLQPAVGGSPMADLALATALPGPIRDRWQAALSQVQQFIMGADLTSAREMLYGEVEKRWAEYQAQEGGQLKDFSRVSVATRQLSPKSALFLLEAIQQAVLALAPTRGPETRKGSDGIVATVDAAQVPYATNVVLSDIDHVSSTVKGMASLINIKPEELAQASVATTFQDEILRQAEPMAAGKVPGWISNPEAALATAVETLLEQARTLRATDPAAADAALARARTLMETLQQRA